MAGLSAAAWSVRQGRSVVLVEKGELGGSAARAGFIWTAPTVEALREAIPDGDPQLAERLIEGFGPAVEWVRSMGAEVQPPSPFCASAAATRRPSSNYFRACELAVRDDRARTSSSAETPSGYRRGRGGSRGRDPVGRRRRARDPRRGDRCSPPAASRATPSCGAELIHPQARDLPLRVEPVQQRRRPPARARGRRAVRPGGRRLLRAPDGDRSPAPGGRRLPRAQLYYSEHGALFNLRGRALLRRDGRRPPDDAGAARAAGGTRAADLRRARARAS